MDLDLTVCCIIKNEEKNLEAFLEALDHHKLVKKVIVDTGSTDNSLKILKDHGIKPYHLDWPDDFAAAKNYAVSLAETPWVLVLDADEYVQEADLNAIEKIVSETSKKSDLPKTAEIPPLGRIRRINETPKGLRTEWITRLFHKD